jgi:glycine/sarcosine N-methyltransferase
MQLVNAKSFYDQLANEYHLVYKDWEDEIRWQSEAISRLLGQPPLRILDCACGIGTQTIGLARLGYKVVGLDLSSKAVDRARRELRKRGIRDTAVVAADLRNLPTSFQEAFEAVICCDNPLAHMLTNADLQVALRSMNGALRKGGKLILTSRDYDTLLESRPSQMPIRRSIVNHRTILVFQLWNWQQDGQTYVNEHFIMQRGLVCWRVNHLATQMRAHRRGEITEAAEVAGFINIEWKERDETGYFQPVMMAIRPMENEKRL